MRAFRAALLALSLLPAGAGAVGAARSAPPAPPGGTIASGLPVPELAGFWANTTRYDRGARNVVTFSADEIWLSRVRADGRVVDQRLFGRITGADPVAQPATLDVEVVATASGDRHTSLGIYRIAGDRFEGCFAGGPAQPAARRPAGFDAGGTDIGRPSARKVHDRVVLPGGRPARPCSADPRLTGDWCTTDERRVEISPDGSRLVTRHLVSGAVLDVIQVTKWDTRCRPPRLEGVYLAAELEMLVGRRVRMNFELSGPFLTLAHHTFDGREADAWPDALWPTEDTVVTRWERVTGDRPVIGATPARRASAFPAPAP